MISLVKKDYDSTKIYRKTHKKGASQTYDTPSFFVQVLVVLVLLLQNLFVSLYCHSSEKDCEIDSPYESSDVWHFYFLYHYKHSSNKEIRELNAKQIFLSHQDGKVPKKEHYCAPERHKWSTSKTPPVNPKLRFLSFGDTSRKQVFCT